MCAVYIATITTSPNASLPVGAKYVVPSFNTASGATTETVYTNVKCKIVPKQSGAKWTIANGAENTPGYINSAGTPYTITCEGFATVEGILYPTTQDYQYAWHNNNYIKSVEIDMAQSTEPVTEAITNPYTGYTFQQYVVSNVVNQVNNNFTSISPPELQIDGDQIYADMTNCYTSGYTEGQTTPCLGDYLYLYIKKYNVLSNGLIKVHLLRQNKNQKHKTDINRHCANKLNIPCITIDKRPIHFIRYTCTVVKTTDKLYSLSTKTTMNSLTWRAQRGGQMQKARKAHHYVSCDLSLTKKKSQNYTPIVADSYTTKTVDLLK